MAARARKKMKKPTIINQRYDNSFLFPILSRLPVKSLLRFLCVCRSWNALIRSSDFVFAHHHIHHMINTIDQNSCSHLLYVSNENWRPRQDCILVSDRAVYNLAPLPLRGCRIIGVCEGLICLIKRSVIYIWNPLIGSMKKVPASGKPTISSEREHEHGALFVTLGFGFGRRTGDYRVVKLISTEPKIKADDWLNEVEVYSLATDSWRKIENHGLSGRWCAACLSPSVCFKGSIYWLGKYIGRILRFDMEEEIFKATVTPDEVKYRSGEILELVVVNGILACLKVKPLKQTRMWLYVNKKVENEVHFHCFPKDENKRVLTVTRAGHIILEGIQYQKMFAYDCYYNDANNLGFELRDLGIYRTSKYSHVIPISNGTLFLLESTGKS